jgi:hypothetical protein
MEIDDEVTDGAKLEVGLDAVEGGGAQGTFYRTGGGAEHSECWWSSSQWSLTLMVSKRLRGGGEEESG